MRYLSVAEIAKKWNISERSVRNYCAHGCFSYRKDLEYSGERRKTRAFQQKERASIHTAGYFSGTKSK